MLLFSKTKTRLHFEVRTAQHSKYHHDASRPGRCVDPGAQLRRGAVCWFGGKAPEGRADRAMWS